MRQAESERSEARSVSRIIPEAERMGVRSLADSEPS